MSTSPRQLECNCNRCTVWLVTGLTCSPWWLYLNSLVDQWFKALVLEAFRLWRHRILVSYGSLGQAFCRSEGKTETTEATFTEGAKGFLGNCWVCAVCMIVLYTAFKKTERIQSLWLSLIRKYAWMVCFGVFERFGRRNGFWSNGGGMDKVWQCMPAHYNGD